ncbi:exocyst complex component 6B-like isoform X1 [Antedon mediterranea]|uniref:exocyst complex component 6B-like isoform X1 n=2 Tax=Antedon mediterranea TaxID=105859 RepID=UPI003AF61EFA
MAERFRKAAQAVSFATMIQADSYKTHNINLVTEIEASEEPIAPTLRVIQDGANQHGFMEHLETRISEHDRDIERMCNFHYQGFVDSIGELLSVRIHAERLKKEVLDTNKALQQSGKVLIEKADELELLRQTQKNIVASMERLQVCLPVLEMYNKLNEQVSNKRYYPALKTLEQLEHTYLPRVQRYRFAEDMAENIPKLRNNIKEASMIDLKDFLESIRKNSDWIGEEAMKQAEKHCNLEKSDVLTNPKSSSLTEADSPEEGGEFDDMEVSAQEKVDFAPVYRCLHIYCVLGERDTFEKYYRNQRSKQARLAIQPPGNMYDSRESYEKYFHQILGFFVVEDHILNTTEGLISREYLDTLWDTSLNKIIQILQTQTASCTDATVLLQIKNTIVIFGQTLRSYGFNDSRVTDLLMELKDQYSEFLMKKWVKVFSDIFYEDNYTAMVVYNQEELNEITRGFPFSDDKQTKITFPKTLPFSAFVPKVYHQIKEFIYACLKFSEDLKLSQNEMDDMIRKSTNILLTRTLSGCLSELIRKPLLGLAELVQVTVNTMHLENACKYLETFISNITGAVGENISAAGLQSSNIFRDARSEAELEIYRKLNRKIDEFLELAEYDWVLDEPKGRASTYLLDLIGFLRNNFTAFNHLPGKVAQTACLSACKHLANGLREMLLGKDSGRITIGAIQQFSLDVIQCEQFANSEPVPGFREGALQMTFVELRQLLDLFMAWDWSSYLADHGQSRSKYSRVNPNTAIILLEKMRESDKKKNLFTTFKKNERDKKKLMDTVLKQLRGLAGGGQRGQLV